MMFVARKRVPILTAMAAALEAGADGAGHSLWAFPVGIVVGTWWWIRGLPDDSLPTDPADDLRRMSNERSFEPPPE
jgi:hypothetical protein